MKVNLNPEGIRASMQLWRDAVDLKLQLEPSIRSHMMVMRRQILNNYVGTARNWLVLLRDCVADAGEEEQLQNLRQEIEDFRAWAEAEIRSIMNLAKE